ncbi:bem46 protein, variant [Ophidiomyces ophidiicola]|nr:bem46 protein, variant [Ophidiomyces ophidiicola]KAI1920731.1 bem46 protein, variant [Ophidiomyces ophidiicola]KAI1928584.1 bem46 protein, variant [Ophidiomyces ophidiicola]KAI2008803.1 bem46 protein, variant [Ophidiomyces ophidiicola]KAI2019237.1 bem46 protein, variant [Ophidiomyces ophidiicola]
MSNTPPPPPPSPWNFSAMAGNVVQFLRLPLLASSGIAAVASGMLYFKQNDLIYPRNFPPGSRTDVPKPSEFGMTDYDDLRIPTPDGEILSALYIRPTNKTAKPKVTMLVFHGNAGNIGQRCPIARVFGELLNCNILLLEYRGYGLSTGNPDEGGLKIDAQTGLDYLRQLPETKGTKFLIYGQSLGGAVAINLVAKNQEHGDIAGLIVENTFLSIRKLIPSVFPAAKYVTRLCHQQWPSEEVLPKITSVPILFLSGLKDEIIPASHMIQLYKVCQAKKKVWRTFPNGSHNDTVTEPGYFEHMHSFVVDEVLD